MCLNHLRLTVKAITAYCRKFPQALVRVWKYNNEVEEFFVEDETVVKVKRADIYRERHTTEMDDLQLKCQIWSHVRSYICIYQYINAWKALENQEVPEPFLQDARSG